MDEAARRQDTDQQVAAEAMRSSIVQDIEGVRMRELEKLQEVEAARLAAQEKIEAALRRHATGPAGHRPCKKV